MTNDLKSPQATADGPPTELCKHCGRTYGSHYYPGAYCASGGMCYDPMTAPQPTAESGQPDGNKTAAEPTWVPVYVERAICDLIPDVGYAREIARQAWAWDDEHVGYENALYKWQNEAIRQRRDLIACEELRAYEQEPVPAPPAESERVSTKRRIAVVIDGEKYVPHSHKISDEAVRLAKELVLETRDGIHAKASRLLYLLTDASGRAR